MSKPGNFTPDEDAPLLLAWHRGDMTAFETLVWKYLRRVFSLAFYLTGNGDSAATATQNAFFAAYDTIGSFSSRLHFANWLLALSLKEIRKILDYPDGGQTGAASPPADLQEELAELIRQLPTESAEVLILRDMRGYSLSRIAEIYQLRTEILITRLFIAHEMLAVRVKQAGTPVEQTTASDSAQPAPHPEIRRAFHPYLDSSLSTTDADNLRKHLKECGSCREALSGLEWIIEHLRKLPDPEPPPWLAPAIMQRVQTAPPVPVSARRPAPVFILQLGAGLLLLLITVLSGYLLLHDHDQSSTTAADGNAVRRPVPPGARPGKTEQPAGFITSIIAPFRKADKTTAAPGNTPAPTGPLPPVTAPPVTVPPPPSPLPAPAIAPLPVTAPVKSEAAGKRGRSDRPAELPAEWGESLPANPPQKKSPPGRSRGGELAVQMTTEDPVAAIPEIEAAVTALGGKITGRAYSGGSDILYTKIDIDRFFDLMNRLAKTGRIQELPQPPEGAEGPVDLIIRWQ